MSSKAAAWRMALSDAAFLLFDIGFVKASTKVMELSWIGAILEA
jgi:hypothetical protein